MHPVHESKGAGNAGCTGVCLGGGVVSARIAAAREHTGDLAPEFVAGAAGPIFNRRFCLCGGEWSSIGDPTLSDASWLRVRLVPGVSGPSCASMSDSVSEFASLQSGSGTWNWGPFARGGVVLISNSGLLETGCVRSITGVVSMPESESSEPGRPRPSKLAGV